jgi:hypothetical protein
MRIYKRITVVVNAMVEEDFDLHKLYVCDDYEYGYSDNICRYHRVYETTLEEFTHDLVQRFTA